MSEVVRASAPGKVILFGEHAVVYGRPAIAVPITQLQATATVQAGNRGFTIHAPDLNRTLTVDITEATDPLAVAVVNTLRYLEARYSDARLAHDPSASSESGLTIHLESTIPVGRGFGSSAAVSTALVRAVGRYFGMDLSPDEVSRLVYEIEVLHHKTPSGIDNTVIAYGQPVYFVRDETMQRFEVGRPMHLVIADTGITTPTRETVGDVRAGWQRDPERYEALFDRIGAIVVAARTAIAEGDWVEVGRLMDENHARLRELRVSCDALDRLVYAARGAGAMGAKMTGGGRGGNIIAVVMPWAVQDVVTAVRRAGAVEAIETVVR